ncbi:MAG TPA: ATP-binding protein [Polyangiaceae bacterium]
MAAAGRVRCRASVGIPGTSEMERSSLVALTLVQKDMLVVEDVAAEPGFAGDVLAQGAAPVRFFAAAPLVLTDGQTVGLLAVCDVTNRAFTAAQREALSAAARSAVRAIEARALVHRLETIAESAADLVICYRPDGTRLYVSGSAAEVTGFTAEELRRGTGYDFVHPEDLPRIHAAQAAVLAGGGIQRVTYRALHKAGHYHWLETIARPIRDEGGALLEVHAAMREVTARVTAEERQRHVEQAKADLVATISHELRTPLTAIRGALTLLAGGALGPLEEDARDAVRIATQNCDRLMRILNDVLDYERAEAGKLAMSVEEVDTATLVAASVDSLREAARAAGVALLARTAEGGAVLADFGRAVQVVVNLMSNALKFAPRGSAVEVGVERREHERTRIWVLDRGPGVPPPARERLFRRFEQLATDSARRAGGAGLGLAIAKGIVEQLGGAIGYEPREGGGSAFWFELRTLLAAATRPAPPPRPDLAQAVAELRREYLENFPGRVSEVVASLDAALSAPADRKMLERARAVAHKLKGASGSYGLLAFSAVVARAEDALLALLDVHDEEARAPRLEELRETLAAIQQEAARTGGQ